ncbi:MAG: 30S ribosomal protein S9 [Phycisphaerae bacterium]|nr:30S ribosomal protein S9 [Phycisphaerae bacterium]
METPSAAQPSEPVVAAKEAAPSAEQPPAPQTEPAPEPVPPATGLHWGTGRRKSSVARVRILPGDGKVLINKHEVQDYFTQLRDQNDVMAPLELTGIHRQWDVMVNVSGGGTTGQAGAIRLGLARAIMKAYDKFEPALRNAGYLTRDARRVERKKPGQRKARRRFQFSKR